ncbi:hypothetical protein P691DRAFT_634259, partial [Macrolepiota fuliginosa MF-IS2]
PLVDAAGRIFAVLAGRPPGQDFDDAALRACRKMIREARGTSFAPKELNHPRGCFPVINVGVTHGKGTTEPVNKAEHQDVAQRLLQDPDIDRMAGYADCK